MIAIVDSDREEGVSLLSLWKTSFSFSEVPITWDRRPALTVDCSEMLRLFTPVWPNTGVLIGFHAPCPDGGEGGGARWLLGVVSVFWLFSGIERLSAELGCPVRSWTDEQRDSTQSPRFCTNPAAGSRSVGTAQ